MALHPSFSVLLFAISTAAVVGTAGAAETVYDASRHGVVSGPLSAPQEAHGGAVERLLADFRQARSDLDAGRLETAARAFDGIFDESGWPEAAYNASLAHYGLGRYDVALSRADSVHEKAPEDLPGLHLRGFLLRLHGRHADALALAERAHQLATSQGRPVAEAMSLLNVAWSHRFLGDPAAAGAEASRARESADRAGAKDLVAAAWMLEGHLARDRGDRAQSEAAFAKSRTAGGQAARARDADLEVRVLEAEDALNQGRIPRARALVAKLHGPIRAEKDVGTRAVYLLRLAELELAVQGEHGGALLDEAEQLFASGGLEAGRADVLDARSRRLFSEGDVDGAEEMLLACVAIRETLQAPLALAGNRLMLAQIRAHQGRTDEALELVTAAGTVLRGAQRSAEHRAARLVEADVRLQRGEAVQAAELASGVAMEADSAGDSAHLASARATEVLALVQSERADAARDLWSGARRGATDRQAARVGLALARHYESAGRPEEALSEASAVLVVWDAAAEGASVKTSDILEAALAATVNALLSLERGEEAIAVLAARGRAEGELARIVEYGLAQTRLNAGVDAYEAGDFSTAHATFAGLTADPDAAEELRLSARANLGTTLQALGRRASEEGRLAESERWYLDLLDLALEAEDPRLEARAGLRLAEIRLGVEDPPGAADRASAGARAAARAGDTSLEGALWAIAGDALYESDPEQARSSLQKALAAWGSGEASLRKRAGVTYNLALLNRRMGDGAEAAVRAREAQALAERAGLDELARQAGELAGRSREEP